MADFEKVYLARFLAPSVNYARTVVRNLREKLEKKGISCDTPNAFLEPYLRTNRVHVDFVYCDPCQYSSSTFRNADAIFGKRELLAAIPPELQRWLRVPKESLEKYIILTERGGDDSEHVSDPTPKTSYLPEISKVHFNPPMTIVLWEDGTKTTVRCQEDDAYSDEVGLALCIAKKALGNKGNFNNVFRKWLPEGEYSEDETIKDDRTVGFNFDGGKFLNNVRESLTERLRNTVKECITND